MSSRNTIWFWWSSNRKIFFKFSIQITAISDRKFFIQFLVNILFEIEMGKNALRVSFIQLEQIGLISGQLLTLKTIRVHEWTLLINTLLARLLLDYDYIFNTDYVVLNKYILNSSFLNNFQSFWIFHYWHLAFRMTQELAVEKTGPQCNIQDIFYLKLPIL